MSPNALIEPLLGSHVWRASQASPARSSQSTGHVLLDAALPGGGWPDDSLIEVLLTADGMGELALLLPTIACLTATCRHVVLVGPAFIPYSPAWQCAGVNLQYLHVVEAREKQCAWAFEQILRSASCAAVLAWPDQVDAAGLRRLQLAANEGRSLGFLFRDICCAVTASPAALRLELQAQRQVLVRKCRGGMPATRPVPIAPVH